MLLRVSGVGEGEAQRDRAHSFVHEASNPCSAISRTSVIASMGDLRRTQTQDPRRAGAPHDPTSARRVPLVDPDVWESVPIGHGGHASRSLPDWNWPERFISGRLHLLDEVVPSRSWAPALDRFCRGSLPPHYNVG